MTTLKIIEMVLFIIAMISPMLMVAYNCIILDIIEAREEKRKADRIMVSRNGRYEMIDRKELFK